jgi:TolB-like protein
LLAVALIFVVVDNYVLEAEPEQAEGAAEHVPAAEPIEREKSIAVLPFANISSDPENAYFTDGIHDEVLAQLSKIRDLKVISRTSVMRYRGEDRPSSPEIGAALGVTNILEGSVRLAGNRVRITIQFIEAERDAHLWTETYDRELTAANIFSIQSEIAKIVADALRATLTPEEQDQIAMAPTKNLAAYQAYLLGKQRLAKRSSGSLAEAVDYFEQAIDLDPNFALAYVGLAYSYTAQIDWSGMPKDEMIAKAEPLVERALELNDRLGEAYAELGFFQIERADFEGAEATYQRALELSPNYSDAYRGYGVLLRYLLGRPEEALILQRKAVELDPLSGIAINQVGQSLELLGRFDEGLSWYEKALEVEPGNVLSMWNIGHYYWLVSAEYHEAVRWLRKEISSDLGDPMVMAQLGRLYLDLGDPDQGEYWIHRSIELGPESFVPNLEMQLLHLHDGDEFGSLDYGRRALAIKQQGHWGVLPVQLIGNHEQKAGRYAEARALYEQSRRELLSEDDPRVGNRNYSVAIDLAAVLSKTGEQERADLLLNRSLQHIQTLPRLSGLGYGVADVRIYALQGEEKKALSALRQAIDEGWRSLWWYFLKLDPTLESLHDEPEFQAMVTEIEADMADQLERVREMERNGEFEPIPEISTTIQ